MKYNPADVAMAWIGERGFTVADVNGKIIHAMEMTQAESEAQLEALRATGLLSGVGSYNAALNPALVACIYHTGDKLKFDNAAGRNIISWEGDSATGMKAIESLQAASPAWMRVPGKMATVNVSNISAVRFAGEALEFINHKGEAVTTSGNVSPQVGRALITKAKAAIDACKSVKAASTTAAAAAAETPSAPKLTAEERTKLRDMFNTLKKGIFGQDEPLVALTEAVRRARAGLQKPNKPIGSFLFLGPTGVGKTEVARQLAKSLGYEFKKFDMSEYMEKISVSRLTGGSPNYVGYEEGGQLTNFVQQHPKSVLLFDEIEKAHPDVANALLQVMDDAVLTDGKGKIAKFQDTIIIMTSNLGTGFTERRPIGFHTDHDARETSKEDVRESEAVKGFFLAEFMNRLTDVIKFKPLTSEVMLQMVDKFVEELADRLIEQTTDLVVTPAARKYLATEGYSETLGARPLERVMEKMSNPLANEIIFGCLQDGGIAVVDVEADKDKKNSQKLVYKFNMAAAEANDNKVFDPARQKAPEPGRALMVVPKKAVPA